MRQKLFAARRLPVVIGIFEAMQRRGNDIVEVVNGAASRQRPGVKQIGKFFQLVECLALQRAEKMMRIYLIESGVERRTGCRQIKQKYEQPFSEYPHLIMDFQIIIQVERNARELGRQ